VLERLAQRDDDVARLEPAAGRAGQKRRVEEEVRVVDDGDPRAAAWELALEGPRAVEAAVAPSGDDDVPGDEPTIPCLGWR